MHGVPSALQLGPVLKTHTPVGSHAFEQHWLEVEQLDPFGLQTGGGDGESKPESTPESVPSSIFPPQATKATPNMTKASKRMGAIMY